MKIHAILIFIFLNYLYISRQNILIPYVSILYSDINYLVSYKDGLFNSIMSVIIKQVHI